MSLLSFDIDPAGLMTDLVIGLDLQEIRRRQGIGQPIPNGIQVRALIDSGSDITCIAPSILSALGIAPYARVGTQTASSPALVGCFYASLCLIGHAGISGPSLVQPKWTVHEFLNPSPSIDALIGLDFLTESLLVIDFPRQQFTLSF